MHPIQGNLAVVHGFRYLCWCCVLLVVAGCSRTHYRLQADRETYGTLDQETACMPWQAPAGFTVTPDPQSRFFDPTPVDDPCLPTPSPQLYAYTLPDLPARDANRFRAAAGAVEPIDQALTDDDSVLQASYEEELRLQEGSPPLDADQFDQPDMESSDIELKLVPIPKAVWESLPSSCLPRMFEFESVREEYHRTFKSDPADSLRDSSQRLALEDIIELALINSREYQAQKEALYQTALRLSLERFDYDLKFSTGGNRTAADYTHNRTGGTTVNGLSVPTTVTGDKLLATGGDMIARFANDVVLTFNGPSGFAADVGSELLFDVSQSVFQRDAVLERLTQAERDLVYAARDFARYRKELFARLAADYYGLILSYRGIEIGAQDYFSNLRAFNQGEEEYYAGRLPRLEVDQFEQTALTSRSSLIGNCSSLEDGLDRLKLNIGLPTELPINLDLTELDELTLRDESTVSAERVRRARRALLLDRDRPGSDRGVLLNDTVDLTQRMLALAQLRRRLGLKESAVEPLEVLLAQLSSDEARLSVEFNRRLLQKEQRAGVTSPPLKIFQRTMNLVNSMVALVRHQVDLASRQSADPASVAAVRRGRQKLADRHEQIAMDLAEAVANRQLERIPELKAGAEALLAVTEPVAEAADRLTDAEPRTPEEALQYVQQQVERLLTESQQLLDRHGGGLAPVELEMDDAMLTALSRRFDVMNQRGELADTWRAIKLAGDDLKSVLNLNASQSIRTRKNRPLDFTFDESQTRLSLALDTPLNRKAQRNAFRSSLIDYQAGLRNLMQLEDDVKLSIRGDLRSLQLGREQYQIAVTSAALANDRVISTRLQLQLGAEGVQARDFVDAQRAYTQSLLAVARQHVDYVLDRIQFFMDLELLEVDRGGFWPGLYDEQHQPAATLGLPSHAQPAYGELPRGLWYSHKIKRMLKVPTGCAVIYKDDPNTPPPQQEPPAEEIPAPAPLPDM
ncbi:MAG: TolC family protein [Candidatus Nealsonbacteria bacterium]|nr:TolC family protein [Candidatus Nealsonbacteria bacterium]